MYLELRKITRQAQFSNPLLDFDNILFLGYASPGSGHMCDQYYGWNARSGGGLYILRDFKTDSPTLINVVENSTVENGRLQGQRITGGPFMSPDLSFDGDTIAFAWADNQCWHIFRVNVDGSNLRQLTDGENPRHDLSTYNPLAEFNARQNDFDPCWLPGGRIAFISQRRGGLGRCHGRDAPSYTLFSMNSDGSDIICIDWHETNEWHPSVNNDGMIVYTRWDYVDREDCIAHHLWTCFPDGRDPRAPHGNYPVPLTTLSGSNWPDGRVLRPFGEWNIRAIPGSRKYVATAGAHHEQSFGSFVIIDTRVEDDDRMSQVQRLTPEEPFPESEAPQYDMDGVRSTYQRYGTAWPLSEDYYLCSYDNNIVLLDRWGNKELIWTVENVPGSATRLIDPIPVKARAMPPVIPTQTFQGERLTENSPNATIYVNNVYVTDEFGALPEGVNIKWMRIVQIFPKMTNNANDPNTGYFTETLARLPLGVVPVEDDGSVYCEAPVEKEIYFQLLDERGMAVQSMRSGTYVHPGEQMSCTGCHESKWEAIPITPNPLAMQRPPSRLEPEVDPQYIWPYSFHRAVAPVLQEKCAPCHNNQGGPDMSYGSLRNYAFGFDGHQRCNYLVPRWGGSRTLPGEFGSHYARLTDYLDESHYNVSLTDDEFRRITMWLDLNSVELSAYYDVDAQRRGEVVWPRIDVDPQNPQGVERRVVSLRPAKYIGKEMELKAKAIPGNIKLQLPVEDNFIIKISNIAGKNNRTFRVNNSCEFSFSTHALPAGVYLIEAISAKNTFRKKLFVFKSYNNMSY
jgi:hypothetical protein